MMMPDRMGIIGSIQGVNASSTPKPKKLAITHQKLPDSNSVAMSMSLEKTEVGEADEAGEGADEKASPPRVGTGVLVAAAARSSDTRCFCGG